MSLGLGPALMVRRTLAGFGVELAHGVVQPVGHPDRSRRDRDTARTVSDGHALRALVDLRIDPVDAPRAGAGDPHEACSHRDRCRIAVHLNRLLHRPAGRIDARHGAVEVVHDPERSEACRHPPRAGADPHLLHEPVAGGIDRAGRAGVDARKRVCGVGAAGDDDRCTPPPPRAMLPRLPPAPNVGVRAWRQQPACRLAAGRARSSAGSWVRIARSSPRSSGPGSTPA